MIVYISPGNSDDKLTQAEWAQFTGDIAEVVVRRASKVWGSWYSSPIAPWQNACWCIEISPRAATELRHDLSRLARKYRQDSISWAEVGRQEFIS